MKKGWKIFVYAAAAGCLLVPLVSWGAGGTAGVQPATREAATIRQEIVALMQERDVALHEWQTRYQNAPLDQRTTLEGDGARLTEQYERQYLQLAVEYNHVIGNSYESAKAQSALDVLNGSQVPMQSTQTKKGGVQHEQK